MKSRGLKTVVVLSCVVAAPVIHAGELPEWLALQQGLYLQYTRGDAEAALVAYRRAEARPELAETARQRQRELQQLLGRSAGPEALLAALAPQELKAALGQAHLLPAECEVVGRLDFQALLASRFVGQLKVKAQLEADGVKLDELGKQLGFDPFRDISTLSFCATLAEQPSELRPVENWLVIAEGRFPGFEPGALAALLGAQSPGQGQSGFALKRERIHGVDTLRLRLPFDQDPQHMQQLAVARPDEKLLLVGEPRALERALAARAGRVAGLWANRALRPVLQRVSGGVTLWVAAMPGQVLHKVQKTHQLGNLPAKLPELEGLLVTLTLGHDIELQAVTRAGDAESAKLLADLARGLLAVAQLAPVEDELARRVLRSIRIETQDLDLQAALTVPGELVEKEMQEHERHRHKHVKRIKLRITMKPGEKRTLQHQACAAAGEPGTREIHVEPAGIVDCQVDEQGRLTVSARQAGQARIRVECGPNATMVVKVTVAR